MARKPKYREDWAEKAEEMAGKGCGDNEIYKALGISHQTFYRWIREPSEENPNPDFISELSESIKRGRERAVQEVENALFKTAIGFETIEEHTEIQMDKDGNPMPAKVKKVKKKISPNPTAQIFFLKNRGDWRDSKQIETDFGGSIMIIADDATKADLNEIKELGTREPDNKDD